MHRAHCTRTYTHTHTPFAPYATAAGPIYFLWCFLMHTHKLRATHGAKERKKFEKKEQEECGSHRALMNNQCYCNHSSIYCAANGLK